VSDESFVRKSAILLMSLPQEQAAQVMGKLSPRQVEAVSIEIAKLDRVDSDEQEQVILDFAEENPNALTGEIGGLDLATALVQKALGSKATATLDSVRQSVDALPFGFLRHVDAENLQTFINDEHPQTIALILSHLPPSYGAELISGLTTERQLAVIRRLATMGQTSPEVINEVEAGLESRMKNVMSQQLENAGGVASVAEILNVTDRATERALLENLAQEDPDLVDEIRRLMFVFEDIIKLSKQDVQAVLKNVETQQWAMALKSASEELKQTILDNMSQRAAAMLNEEMEYLGPVRLSDVENVQQRIVDMIRSLEDAGEMSLNTTGESEEFVE